MTTQGLAHSTVETPERLISLNIPSQSHVLEYLAPNELAASGVPTLNLGRWRMIYDAPPVRRIEDLARLAKRLPPFDKGEYEDALSKIESVLRKTDGCANTSAPDSNDWIIDCDAQQQVYWLLFDAIALLDEIIAG